MVIGYSFSDTHINACIADAVRTRNLHLYVWNTRGPRELLLHRGDISEEAAQDLGDVYQGLLGCCTRGLDEVFPPDQRITEDYRTICNQFFLGPGP